MIRMLYTVQRADIDQPIVLGGRFCWGQILVFCLFISADHGSNIAKLPYKTWSVYRAVLQPCSSCASPP